MIDQAYKSIMVLIALAAFAANAHADCKTDLKAVMDAAQSSGPFHVETSIASVGVDMKMSGNIVPPDEYDLTTPQGRMIITREGAWMQQDGGWTKMPDTMREMIAGQVSVASTQTLKNANNIKCLGAQDFEGTSYTAFEFNTSGQVMGIEAKSHVMLYADGGKPVVSLIDGEAMGQKSKTVQKITYDSSIKIAAPQ